MKRRKNGGFLIFAGLMLIAGAAMLCAYNLYDGQRAGSASENAAGFLETHIPKLDGDIRIDVSDTELPTVQDMMKEKEIPDHILNPDMPMPEISFEGQDYIGILEIPALELKLPVISQWSYPSLRTAPCRYSGSAYLGDMVIAAHNYAAHFGSLDKLNEGDEVMFTDADGNVFNYSVALKETLGSRDVEYMTDGGWALSLFTCTPGGSYRVTVRCDAVTEYAGY